MKLSRVEKEFQDLVVESYDDLPPQQQLVATFMLDHVKEVPFLSVPELAGRSGASEATIVRFAQRIGYDGWSGLKAALLDAVREKVVPPGAAEAFARVPEGDALTAVARQETANIQQSIEALDRELVDRVADALFGADQVFSYGLGISSHLASLAAYLLTQVGVRAAALPTSYSSPLEPLVTLRPEDAVLLFSFPPYSRSTLEVAQASRRTGASIVAICDRRTAPAAKLADHALTVKTKNMMYTNSFAAISVLLNCLTTTIALRHSEAVAEAVSRISIILESDERVV